MKSRNLLQSFNYAFEGIIYAFKTQRNMKLHILATACVLTASLLFKISKLEMLVILITIAFVVIAEMINTAIEAVVDLYTQEIHPLAAVAKNVAAGAVLISTTIAIIVGSLIFFPQIDPLIPRVIYSLQRTPAHLTLIALLLTIVLVIVGKSVTKRGTPLQGGMPSGHTALSASAATAIFFITKNGLVTVLASFLLFMVAESRIENKIHSWDEVLIGGILGFLLTLLIFQIMI